MASKSSPAEAAAETSPLPLLQSAALGTAASSVSTSVLNTTTSTTSATTLTTTTTPPPTTTTKSSQQEQYELRFQTMMHPPILPWEMFDGIERHSVDGLCSIGREVVHDLVARAMNLLSIIRINATKMNSNTSHFSVETVLLYSNFLFEKLVEIQTIIDSRCSVDNESTHIPDQVLISSLIDSTQKVENPRKLRLVEEFEQNRAKIIELNCQLKQLEWLSSVSDPRLIKKLDVQNESSKR